MSSVAFSTFCFLSCLPISIWNSRCFYLLFFIHKIITLLRLCCLNYLCFGQASLALLLVLPVKRIQPNKQVNKTLLSCAICSLLCCSSVSCYLCKRIWNCVPCPFVPLASVIVLDYRLLVVTGNRLLIWSIATLNKPAQDVPGCCSETDEYGLPLCIGDESSSICVTVVVVP